MVLEISLEYGGTLRTGSVSVVHLQDLTSPTDIATFATDLIDALASNMISSASLAFTGEVREYDTSTGVLVGVSSAAAHTASGGAGASPATADNVAIYSRLRTDAVAGGRRLAGGIYLSGLPSNIITAGGNLGESARGAVQTDLEGVLGVHSPAWVIWSRVHGVASPVTGVQTAALISQQRRRRS